MTESDAWRILDLEPGADEATIKQAFRDEARAWHPDKHTGDARLSAKANEKLKRINAAYELLLKLRVRTGQPPRATRSEHREAHPPKSSERRSSRRAKVRVPIGLRWSVDISGKGIAVRTPEPLARYEKIGLRFRVPGSKTETKVDAHVVWSIAGVGMGLQFGHLKPADQSAINRFVDQHANTDGILAVCRQCGTLLKVASTDLGKVIRCKCKNTFKLE
jgi:hypothetical protein